MKNGADTLRVACLGAGYFAQFHYEAWRKLSKRVSACRRLRPRPEKAKATGLTAFE